jgi:uncharacterized membrane protein YfcA
MQRYALTAIFGIFAGIFVGMLGTPGYALIVPGLLILSIITDYSKAVGTYLLMAAVPLTLASAYIYYKRKDVELDISLILMVTVFIGSIGGAYLSKYVSDNNRERIAGTIETIIGPWYLLRSFGLVP